MRISKKSNRPNELKGIRIIYVENKESGLFQAEQLVISRLTFAKGKSALFLSGGTTPQSLYESMAKNKKIAITTLAAAAMVDERFSNPFHKDSNEKMIKETGLLAYLESEKIPFYKILNDGYNRKKAAAEYEKTLLRKVFPKCFYRIAILGMGEDGHTAGILPNRNGFKNHIFDGRQSTLLVADSYDENPLPGGFRERITLTPYGLSRMDSFILLAFGDNKKEALEKMFEHGRIEEIPARFYTGDSIASKMVLITDQRI